MYVYQNSKISAAKYNERNNNRDNAFCFARYIYLFIRFPTKEKESVCV